MFRRRRKPKVVWLPNFGAGFADPQVRQVAGVNGFTFAIQTNGTQVVTAAQSLTFDFDAEQFLAANVLPSLSDFEGKGYRLRRIVGKCFAGADHIQPPQGQTKAPAVLFGAGFIVLRTNPENGQPTAAVNSNAVTPIGVDSTDDPWIWRRVWTFSTGAPGDNSATDNAFGQQVGANSVYGSVADGPHIDQKTARVIKRDERLFFVISIRQLPLLTNYNNDTLVTGYLDYRLLASMRLDSGNRRNASR